MLEILKRNWLLIIVALIILVFIFFFSNQNLDYELEVDASHSFNDIGSREENEEEEEQTVVVDIKGEVNHPGVYEIDSNARVHDVIKLAGGFTKNADEFPVNLAQKVQDEMVIIVPNINDFSKEGYEHFEEGKVRINYATQEEIETLNGIGPAKAQAIIQYREENGFFQKVEDLLEVSGIGEKTLDNIREDIQIP